jgi:transposase
MWAGGDELITLTQAAEICGRSVSSLSQLVDRGTITGYVDPSEPNSRRRSRVSRSEIEKLKKK